MAAKKKIPTVVRQREITQEGDNKTWMMATVMGGQLEQKGYKMPLPEKSRKAVRNNSG